MFKLKYSAYCGSLSAVLLPVLLTSCALPPPARDLHNLTPQGTYRQATPPDEDIPASEAAWWAQFNDPRLLQLIAHAQQANPDVLIALQRVQEARAGMRAAQGAAVPSLSLAASASDNNSGLPDAIKQGVPDTRNRTAGLDTRWEIDLSGALRKQYSAAQHDALAADWGVRGARLMVKGEVARQYFLWQGALARQALLQQIILRQEQQLALLQLRLDAGLASPLQRDQLAAALNSQRAELPALHSLQIACENHLAVLLGQSPNQPLPELTQPEPGLSNTLPTLSPGQPAELLRRRPDLMAAEHKLRAEGARLDQAYANQWPKLYLDALFGREELTLNNVTQVPVRFSQIGLTFTLPIFSGGRIQAAIDAQTAREQAAWLDYRRQILAALEDVENSLVLRQDEAQRLAALSRASEAQTAARRRADALLAEGQIDQSIWLDAERARLAAELARTDSLVQSKLNLIQLYKAMGGGWPTTTPSIGNPQS